MKSLLFVSLLLAAVGPFEKSQAQSQITVTAVNRLNMARESETIEVNANALASLAEKDLMKLHVFDSAGKEVLAQAVDTDYDEYHIPSAPAWKRYLDDFRERLNSPIAVTVK